MKTGMSSGRGIGLILVLVLVLVAGLLGACNPLAAQADSLIPPTDPNSVLYSPVPPREPGEHVTVMVPDTHDMWDFVSDKAMDVLGTPPDWAATEDGDKVDINYMVCLTTYWLNWANTPYLTPKVTIQPGAIIELPKSWEEVKNIYDWYGLQLYLAKGLG